MSYILEALRKAERERNLGQVPTLEAKADNGVQSSRVVWPWLLAAALAVNAIVLGIWLVYPRAPEPVMPPPVAVAEPRPMPPPPAVSDYMPPPTTIIEEPVSEPPVATVREPAVSEPTASPAPKPRATSPRPVEAVEAQDAFVNQPAIEDRQTVVTALRDMPPEFRRSLPEMKIDAHFYTEVSGRSFVMINLRKYKLGERLAEGPQVVDIVPDGVILSHQGKEFLLPP